MPAVIPVKTGRASRAVAVDPRFPRFYEDDSGGDVWYGRSGRIISKTMILAGWQKEESVTL
jgi:hypothetical protein